MKLKSILSALLLFAAAEVAQALSDGAQIIDPQENLEFVRQMIHLALETEDPDKNIKIKGRGALPSFEIYARVTVTVDITGLYRLYFIDPRTRFDGGYRTDSDVYAGMREIGFRKMSDGELVVLPEYFNGGALSICSYINQVFGFRSQNNMLLSIDVDNLKSELKKSIEALPADMNPRMRERRILEMQKETNSKIGILTQTNDREIVEFEVSTEREIQEKISARWDLRRELLRVAMPLFWLIAPEDRIGAAQCPDLYSTL